MTKIAHLFIFGGVIGVGFRAWTTKQARSLGLRGWVRNFDHHTVEAVFDGPKEKLETMIENCRKGPDVSWVEKVDIKWEKAKEELKGFTIK